MSSRLRILSLGWGVQTWALAAMIANGDIEPVDYMVFADTTHERFNTYEFLRQWTPWLEERGQSVVIVKGDRTNVIEHWKSETVGVMIPAFTFSLTGSKGQLRRQCTRYWKILPIRRFIREEMERRGIKRSPGVVQSVQGISQDEWMRMRDSDVAYIENVYPLVDLRMTRDDCKAYLESKGLPTPPKSSCVFCPYHNKAAWEDMKKRGGPDWKHALKADESVRNKRNNFELFIHPARKPLMDALDDHGQMELWPDATCDGGHCFV